MQDFLKLDLTDEDNPVRTTVRAESLEALLEAEVKIFAADDRLCPVYGNHTAECLSHDEDSVQWEPGDGGQYTIAVYAPATPEGQAKLDEYLS